MCPAQEFARIASGHGRLVPFCDPSAEHAHTAPPDNFNLVKESELKEMCGVGRKKARLIMTEFEEHGAFESYDDVQARCFAIGDRHIALFKTYGWKCCAPLRCVECGEMM